MSKFIFTVFIITYFTLPCSAAVITGKVISIADGDTVHVLTSENRDVKIRLNKIDAPEHNQDFGEKSKQFLSGMIFNKIVNVEYEKIDKYGRVLGVIYLNGIDINLKQVKEGMAWVYRRYTSDKTYINAEENARRLKIGLWVDKHPVNPENFRHKSKETVKNTQNIKRASLVCGKKRYCSEMISCVEAKFYLSECGISSLDKDGDGVACESLCR